MFKASYGTAASKLKYCPEASTELSVKQVFPGLKEINQESVLYS